MIDEATAVVAIADLKSRSGRGSIWNDALNAAIEAVQKLAKTRAESARTPAGDVVERVAYAMRDYLRQTVDGESYGDGNFAGGDTWVSVGEQEIDISDLARVAIAATQPVQVDIEVEAQALVEHWRDARAPMPDAKEGE